MPTDWLLDKYEHLIVIFKRYQQRSLTSKRHRRESDCLPQS